MPGPAPKDPEIRQRRNAKTEAGELMAPASDDVVIPEIPNPDGRQFHALALKWWDELWRSPMAAKFLPMDAAILGMTVLLVDDFFKADKASQRILLSAEIRQQTARFGLSNWDRNRMNWTIADEEREKKKPAASGNSIDPRKVLKAV